MPTIQIRQISSQLNGQIERARTQLTREFSQRKARFQQEALRILNVGLRQLGVATEAELEELRLKVQKLEAELAAVPVIKKRKSSKSNIELPPNGAAHAGTPP